MHIHVVKRGDTLSSIAAMHDALPAFVAADNGLTLSTPLVIGQALVVRTPKTLHTVRAGETLSSIARDYDLSVRTLLRRNFFLHGRELLREGDVLAIDYADEAPLGTLGVNAYAYPYIGGELLDSVLPYLTYLTPFTYGITPAGVLAPLDDARLLERAARYGAKSLMHLSTLTPEGNFSSENAAALLQNDRAQSALLAEILQTMAKKGYYGLDVDFEYVPPELREDYAAFVCRLREALNAEGKPVVAALAPKTSAQQRGLLYEAHDYALLSKAANAVFLMTYEWGYAYGEPQAIAPLPQVRAVLDYALLVTAGENIFLGAPLYAYDWPLPYEKGRTRAETFSSQAAVARARLRKLSLTKPRARPATTTSTKCSANTSSGSRTRARCARGSPSRRKRACRASASGRRGGSSRRRGRCSTRWSRSKPSKKCKKPPNGRQRLTKCGKNRKIKAGAVVNGG